MGGNVIVVTSLADYLAHIQSGKAVVVDFFATWCPPCKRISPYFEQLSTEFTNVVFLKVDVDSVPDVASKESISAMPTFLMYKGGSKVDELVGASNDRLKEMITRNS